jgi:Flp pilus assembly protein TadD
VLTLPSHTSILTGLYPFQHGVRENSGYRVAAGTQTLATRLKRAGYATAAFVAAFPVHSRFGLNTGFDVYDDRFGETRAPTEFVMPERPASEVVPLARAWIAGHASARWFVWVHVFDPHAPYRPPPPFDRAYANRPYYGEVAATDAALAPLLDDVRASNRPTIVVATGDHGEGLGDHGEESHGVFAYEATLRVPLIVTELGRTQGTQSSQSSQRNSFIRRVSAAFASLANSAALAHFAFSTRASDGEISSVSARHVDILPTILDAVAEPVPSDLPGRSLLPAAERRPGSAMRTSYFEAMAGMLNRGWAPLTGVLADRDKYIDLPIVERYDLASDPDEATNLAGRSAERDRTLATALRGFNASLPGERRREEPEAAARLRALGYVAGDAPLKTRFTEADDPKRLVDLDAAIHNGVAAFGARRFDEAVHIYRQIIAKRPDMAIAYRHLAFVEWERGDVNGAIDVLRQAMASGAGRASVITQLGTYLAETGRGADAVTLLEPLAADRAPATNDADTLNALGIAYARAGRTADATRTFDRVLTMTPDSAIPLENLGVLALGRGDLAAARRLFEHAIQVDPRSSQAHADLGVVAVKNGDRRAAVQAWTEAVALDPTNYDALYNLGTTLARDGQAEAARPYLEQFVRTAPAAFYAKDIREITAILQSGRR